MSIDLIRDFQLYDVLGNTDDVEMLPAVDEKNSIFNLGYTESFYILRNGSDNTPNFNTANYEANKSLSTGPGDVLFIGIKATRFKTPKIVIISHINLNSL